jgi:hypothetical protein
LMVNLLELPLYYFPGSHQVSSAVNLVEFSLYYSLDHTKSLRWLIL